jgi:hypothetical protein
MYCLTRSPMMLKLRWVWRSSANHFWASSPKYYSSPIVRRIRLDRARHLCCQSRTPLPVDKCEQQQKI